MTGKTDIKFLLTVTAVTAIAVAVASYFIFASLAKKDDRGPDAEQIQEQLAMIGMLHMYYDGLMLNREATLDKYDNKGNLLQQNIRLGDLTGDKKLVGVFSTNNCSSCARLEMTLLNNLALGERLIVVYDTPMHEYLATDKLPAPYYYELTGGPLAAGMEPKAELPILLLTEGDRVKTSCAASTTTSKFTREFHEYAAEQLKPEDEQ